VLEARKHNDTWHLALEIGTDPQAVFRTLAARENVKIEHFELEEPSLDDIFINVVQNGAASPSATLRTRLVVSEAELLEARHA
jgi:ABC-type uncharacterized transport system ATPase subunit